MINNLNSDNWIELYIKWELSLIKELNKFTPGNILVHIEYGFCKFIGI